jgi:hypothetical protein
MFLNCKRVAIKLFVHKDAYELIDVSATLVHFTMTDFIEASPNDLKLSLQCYFSLSCDVHAYQHIIHH